MKKGLLGQALLIAGLVLNISCADSSDSKNNNPAGGNPHEAAKDTTNLSVCQGPTPIGMDVFQSWRSDSQTSSGLSFTTIVTVEYSAIQVRVTCRDPYNQATAVVRANASVTGNSIRTLSNDQDEVTVGFGDRKLTCSASITANQQMNYSFQGPCLKTHFGSETQILIPAN